MSTKTVLWTSYTLLPCAGCLPADAILCLGESGAAKLAQRTCSDEATPTDFSWTTIPVQISKLETLGDSCGRRFYRYTFSYDDTLLLTGQILLQADISGAICEGCLTQWVRDTAGQDVVLSRPDAGHLTLVNQHGCAYTVIAPTISTDGGNLLTLGSDGGLYLALG